MKGTVRRAGVTAYESLDHNTERSQRSQRLKLFRRLTKLCSLRNVSTEIDALLFVTFCKKPSVFVSFVIFPYCANRIGQEALSRLNSPSHPFAHTDLLFAIRAPRLRLITHEKQSNPGHHACEQHDSENEENISQGVVGHHSSEYSSRHVKQPAKREEEQEVYPMLVCR